MLLMLPALLGTLIDPDHTTTLPFIRMAAWPMDFTPGGMRNVQRDAWAANPAETMTLATRGNQMAMYVVFKNPLYGSVRMEPVL